MTLDLDHFSPGASLAGGVLIGVAAALLLLGNGRVAGISGILGGLLEAKSGDRMWRAAFIAGLFAAPWVLRAAFALPVPTIAASWPTVALAGLLVGIGTRYAAGCTSGHGVCGISRGSVRSIVATLVFMSAGFLTVFVCRHVTGA